MMTADRIATGHSQRVIMLPRNLGLFLVFCILLQLPDKLAAADPIRYTADGKLILPDDYREWIFLNAGVGMTYGPSGLGGSAKHPFFDNVFVNREAYQIFKETGKWPDKTIFLLEIRRSASNTPPNVAGHFQTDLVAVEGAVKDESKPEKWLYFDFHRTPTGVEKEAKPLPRSAGCWACHAAMGASDNTFLQFYPTLYPIAEAKGTLSPRFKKPVASQARVYHAIASSGWAGGKALLEDAAQRDPETAVLEERALAELGQDLLREKRAVDAVELLNWAVAQKPQSALIWSRLADAQAAQGDAAKARESAQKVLELLPAAALPDAVKKRLEESAQARLK
jgi:tetratricopeptide (TPR) repeat protein